MMCDLENRMVIDSEWAISEHYPIVGRCCVCEDDICEGEIIYRIPGGNGVDVLHEDCLKEWAEIFKKEAK